MKAKREHERHPRGGPAVLDVNAVRECLELEPTHHGPFPPALRALNTALHHECRADEVCQNACTHVLPFEAQGGKWTALGLANVLARRDVTPEQIGLETPR